MDNVREFFRQHSDERPRGNFHKVIALHEAPDIDWKYISDSVPDLPKGWFELSRLPVRDRIEFIRDFWMDMLPYRQGVTEFLIHFFEELEDIGVYITQHRYDDPYEICLVYKIKGDNVFFRGGIPAAEEEIVELQALYPDKMIPQDYKAFLKIHNGFWKTTDYTGIAKTNCIPSLIERFRGHFTANEFLLTPTGREVSPLTLIPFYESFGMPFFQCFWSEWYPEEEMGNVYCSCLSKSIPFIEGNESNSENMAFATFLDWLMFYLEEIK